jgi:hypothetical protein
VWRFVTLEEVLADWEEIAPHLGRRLEFWEWLIGTWRRLGSIPGISTSIGRGEESVIVDLVHDPTPQAPKLRTSKVRIDSPEEILTNKLCALLSRAEIRDLVDVCELERAGHSVLGALPLAMRKDGGLTPAQLGWVLSKITIGEDARIPGRLAPAELREWLDDLPSRLAGLSLPG